MNNKDEKIIDNNDKNNIGSSNSNIQKPLSVALLDFRKDITKSINESNLSIQIIEMIMKDMYLEIKNISDNYTTKEKEDYEKAISTKNEQ